MLVFFISLLTDNQACHLQRMQPRLLYKLIHVRASRVVLDRLVGTGKSSWFSTIFSSYKYSDSKLILPAADYNYSMMGSKIEANVLLNPR